MTDPTDKVQCGWCSAYIVNGDPHFVIDEQRKLIDDLRRQLDEVNAGEPDVVAKLTSTGEGKTVHGELISAEPLEPDTGDTDG